MPDALDHDFFALLTASHAQLVGQPLVPDGADAEWLYGSAPFAVLAHDTNPDPLFTYANITAQTCFEYAWDELVGLPSRLSSAPSSSVDRQQLLDAVSRDGFVTGYRGLRIARSGRRFWVEDLTMWNLVDADGVRRGQAAAFGRWWDAG